MMEVIWFCSVTIVIHGAVVIFWSLLHGIIEKYSLFPDSKIQTNKLSRISEPELQKCIKQVAFAHLVMQPLGLPLYYLVLKTRMIFDTSQYDWTELLTHIPVYLILEDAAFYWFHRLLHTPFLYKHIHKVHHSYHQPIPLAAEYTHPIDYILTGSLPLFLGPFVMKSHVYTFWIWLLIRATEAMDGHSGYDLWFMPFRYFPFRPGSQVHDYHHSHNKGNYGSFFYFWDKLCGTDLSYIDYQDAKRNITKKKY